MKKIGALFMIFLLISFVSADGVLHIKDDDWKLHSEEQQLAAINYENGFENMILSIDLADSETAEKAIWIFPVPAKPDDVAIDVIDQFPRFSGRNLNELYDGAVFSLGLYTGMVSFFPTSLVLVVPLFMAPMIKNSMGGSFKGISPGEGLEKVVVHETLNKKGVTTKLITSSGGRDLKAYLNLQGYDLPQKSLDVLNDYVDKEYSFVISYIDDFGEFKKNAVQQPPSIYEDYRDYEKVYTLGVFVKFPTDKIYFPLKPTSIYGSKIIPVKIFVIGHVNPDIYDKLSPVDIDYYVNSYNSGNLEFFNKEGVFDYTKISFSAPSKYFEEDLWINSGTPVSVGFKNFFITFAGIIGILVYGLFSIAASLLAGLIFRGDVSKRRLIFMGLFNYLTMIGFLISLLFVNTKKVSTDLEERLKKEKIKAKVRDCRKVGYFFLFYAGFVVMTLLFCGLLYLLG